MRIWIFNKKRNPKKIINAAQTTYYTILYVVTSNLSLTKTNRKHECQIFVLKFELVVRPFQGTTTSSLMPIESTEKCPS